MKPIEDAGGHERYEEGGRHRVLVADPAWPFDDKLPGAGRGAGKHYNLQALDGIKAQALPPMHDDSVLFLWRVAAMPVVAYEVMAAWGFTYKTEIVWFKRRACSRCKSTGKGRSRRYVEQAIVPGSDAPAKVFDGTVPTVCPECAGEGERRHFGMGRIVRAEHEVCLVGVRGRGVDHILSRSVRSAFETLEDSEIVAPAGEHSEKPAAFYEMVEALFPGPYFELHARRTRSGWTSSGHQLGAGEEM